MNFIDRFTLDDVSAKVWWPATLIALIAFVLTFPLGNRAVVAARADAATQAAELTTMQIFDPSIHGGSTSLAAEVRSGDLPGANRVLTLLKEDPWSVARVWAPQHTLWASSSLQEQENETNSSEANNDDALQRATDHGAYSLVTDRLPTGGPGPTVFHAYTATPGPTGDTFVTDFEARDSVLLADVHREWLGYRIVGALATLLFLGLAIASMREPRARIGTNVPFFTESVPAGMAVVDVDRAVELDQADERIQDRISGLQERLDESERLRLKAEAQLQQALTALGSGGRNVTRPPVQAAEVSGPPTPKPRRTEQRPKPAATPNQPAVTPTQPTDIPRQPAASAQPAAATPKQPAAPAPRPAAQQPAARQQPAAARPHQRTPSGQPAQAPQPLPRRTKPVPPAKRVPRATPPAEDPAAKHIAKTQPTKVPPPPVTAPQPAAKAPPPPPKRRAGKPAPNEPVTVSSEDVAVTADASDRANRPEVVVIPEPEKEKVKAGRGANSDADVLDVLNRLVPDNEESHPKGEPGDLRARLARTAALKKPGSRERQEQREANTDRPSQQ